MSLEDLVDAHLEGKTPEVPTELRDDFAEAVAGHAALQYALGETLSVAEPGPADRPPPALPDDYEVVREIGRGGMGVVYLVRQKSLGRMVAVKVLRPGEAVFGRLVQRFLGEARHLARLRHPNIVSIHEVGHAGDEPYFTMDYVEGEPLSAILDRGRLSPSRALAILKQAAEGVMHAHAQGIIHRDLKPGNILVDPQGRAFVTDFGLARDMTATSKLTHSGEVMGTPAYMAPEQAEGRTELIGEATDVHGLGVLLYEMLTGRPPYGCDAPASVLVRLLKEEPTRPRAIDRRIPRDLETICLKALAKAPERRYPTVRAFWEDLRRFESGESVLARRPGPFSHLARLLRRHGKLAAAVLIPLLLLVFLGPRLFDKSVPQLLAVAEEQRAAGEYQAAIRIYRRALAKAGGEQRQEILQRMLACCEGIRDDKSALDACLLVVETDPDLSFGKYDYLVAQAIVARARALDPNQSLRYPTEKNRKLLELAQRRLAIFLDGRTGTPEQRREAQESLAVLQKALAHEPFQNPSYEQKPELPQGSPEELLKQAHDAKVGRWGSGKAAFAAGQTLQKAGDRQAALSAYRLAYELMRPVYPTYDGMKWAVNAPVTPECDLFRKVALAVQDLDPKAPNTIRGGLRIRLEGVPLPPDLALTLRVILYDPSVHGVAQEAEQSILMRATPVDAGGTITLGVADGRYRLTIFKSMTSWQTETTHRIGTLLEIDNPDPPREVEVRGAYGDVPVRVRLLDEIKAVEPADGGTADLQKNFFRWSAVEKAASYQIQFGFKDDTLAGSTFYGLPAVTCSTPGVCLGTLPSKEVGPMLREKLVPGRTGTWSVVAFDASGRRLGAMVESNHPFLVVRGLETK